MKRVISLLTACFMILISITCGIVNAQEEKAVELRNGAETEKENGILIAYFSRADENYNVGVIEKGNTEIMAEMIQEEIGGTLFHIQRGEPYPANYDECTDVAKQEQKEKARPELLEDIGELDKYDVVFLGYPIWWGDLPMAVYTFLEGHDFSGKTIVPFNTHEGSGQSGTVKSIEDTCEGATVLEGLAIRGTTAQEDEDTTREAVVDWLIRNGFLE